MAHRAHEAVVARLRRQAAEEFAGQVLVLGQHRTNDEAPAAVEPNHVDEIGGIAVYLVKHGRFQVFRFQVLGVRVRGA
jgi:cytochrome c biogenesis protein ResB